MARIISFFPFFFLGYILPKGKLEEFSGNRKIIHYILGYIVIAIILTLSVFFLTTFNVNIDTLQMYPYKESVESLIRISIFILSIIWGLGIVLVMPDRKLFCITNAGENSLIIFLLHRFPTISISYTLNGLLQGQIIVISIILTLITTLLLSIRTIKVVFNYILDKLVSIII